MSHDAADRSAAPGGRPTDTTVAGLIRNAVAAHRQGRLAEAEALYRDALARDPQSFDALHLLGVIQGQRLNHAEAIALLSRALEIRPNHAAAHCNLGVALRGAGRSRDALASFDHALQRDPASLDALCNRGHALRDLGDWPAALASYEAALRVRPDQIEALYHRADALTRLDRLEEAVAAYDDALRLRPEFPEASYNRGNALFNLGRVQEAVDSYQDAVRARPDEPRFLNNLGNALRVLGRLPEALESFERALALRPDYAEAHSNRGNALQALNRVPEALACYDRAIELAPDFADAHCNRGAALTALWRLDEAVASYDRALQIAPDHPEVHSNRGTALVDLGHIREGLASYERALALKPDFADAHVNLGMALLLVGDFRRGWVEFDWRWQQASELAKSRPELSGPHWVGEDPLSGKSILLWCEQGAGDSIQFCRFAPMLKAQGATVLLWTHSALESLMASLDGVDRVLKSGEAVPVTDYHCPLLSLPRALDVDPDALPAEQAYLYADPERIAGWTGLLGPRGRPRVGLAWSGNPDHKNDRHRSIPLQHFVAILQGTCEFVCLQKDVREQDRPFLEQCPDLRWFGDDIRDFEDTAALLLHMDVVISVDTSIAHLAGALGRPVWILLSHIPDWRWLLDRDDTPWYPTARLFRQPRPGDWQSVLAEVTQALAAMTFRDIGPETEAWAGPVHTARAARARQEAAIAPLLAQSVEAHRQGRLDDAEALYRQILALEPAHFDALHMLGVVQAQRSNHADAIVSIGRALELRPDNAAAHSNLGNALRSCQRPQEAVASYDRALRIDPAHVDALSNRGHALWELNRPEEAVASYEAALRITPDNADLLYRQGTILLQLGRHEAALSCYDQALRLRPNDVGSLNNRGNALRNLGRLEESLETFDRALAIAPDDVDLLNNRGTVLQDLDRPEEALAALEHALQIQPEFIEANYNRGTMLWDLERHHEALEALNRALQRKPGFMEAYYNRGNTLWRLARHEDALADYDRVLAANPHHVAALNNRGTVLHDMKRPLEAIESYEQALVLAPEDRHTRANAAMCRLLIGDFRYGWQGFEWRGSATDRPDLHRPLWLGDAPLAGKTILLWAEQGLGDTIQFCRFASLVADRGASAVLLSVPAPLESLMTSLDGVTRVLKNGEKLPATDYYCPLPSLPLAFDIGLSTIPAQPQYLSADPARVALWAEKLGPRSRPRIGLVWSGNPEHRNDRNRSIPLQQFIRLAGGAFEFVCLQKEIRDRDQPALEQWPAIRLFHEDLTDFGDTAALAENMDLVIAVDTSLAHLAGALGRPLWLMLPYVPDWRWLLDREDSPWYPTARLFRQPQPGDWDSVLDAVRQELAAADFAAPAREMPPANARPATLRAERQRRTAAIAQLLCQAAALHRDGQLADAAPLYQQVLSLEPENFDALHMLGVLHAQQLLYPQAIELLYQALRIAPDNAAAHCNLANALRGFGRPQEALASYDRALAIDPANADAWCKSGHALRDLDRLEDALTRYDAALRLLPDLVEALYHRANVLFRLQRLPAALNDYGHALLIDPNHVDALVNRGNALLAMQWPEDALACFDRVLAVAPDNTAALSGRGNALRRLWRIDEALATFERALTLVRDDAALFANCAYALEDAGQQEAALACYERALAIAPDTPQVRVNAALCRLLMGDFATGWREYEWRWQLPAVQAAAPRHAQPLWLGETPLSGKTILLWDEQGIGDAIQFCRFAALAAAEGATVVLGVPRPLEQLLAGVEGVSRVVTTYDPTLSVDCHCPLLSLPLAFSIGPDSIPASPRYLDADPALLAAWRGTLAEQSRPRIGLVWSGNPAHGNDRNRSIPLERFIRIADGPFEFICLQQEIRAADQPALARRPDIRAFEASLSDLPNTAALIQHVDLVISVDTALAHLAGALGRPVWILLPHNPDWRWLRHREDSPWYPTARLFRQPRCGDWQTVIDRVVYELARKTWP